MPNLVSRLASLHATLTTRLALQERLLLLNGRLDLALSQVELRSANAPTKPSSKKVKNGGDKEKNVTRYVEGESSEEEMEVDVQEGSDAGDIEEIGLGGKSNQQSDSEEESPETSGEEDSDSESISDDAEDEGVDDEDDDSEDGPRLNGLIDDEAEESWGSEEEEEEEEEE
jgi:U3 small nucleolar RNA-associated protein 5